jgi:hypothetical protein
VRFLLSLAVRASGHTRDNSATRNLLPDLDLAVQKKTPTGALFRRHAAAGTYRFFTDRGIREFFEAFCQLWQSMYLCDDLALFHLDSQ